MHMNGNSPEELTKARKGNFCHLVATEDNSYC